MCLIRNHKYTLAKLATNQGVVGSNPAGRAKKCSKFKGLGLTT
jgi:hypothetical protein